MSVHLSSAQEVAVTLVRLNTATQNPFAVVGLGGLTQVTIDTAAEAYALRDAFQQAGDLLAEAEAEGAAK